MTKLTYYEQEKIIGGWQFDERTGYYNFTDEEIRDLTNFYDIARFEWYGTDENGRGFYRVFNRNDLSDVTFSQVAAVIGLPEAPSLFCFTFLNGHRIVEEREGPFKVTHFLN